MLQQAFYKTGLASNIVIVTSILFGLFLILGAQKTREYWRRMRPMSEMDEDSDPPAGEDQPDKG